MHSARQLVTKLIPPTIVFTPGMITDQRLWQRVWEKFKIEQHHMFINFSNCSTLGKQLNKFDELQFGKLDLVGFSMGGYISLEYVLRHPERISSLVLISTSARGYTPQEIEQREQMIKAAKTNFRALISSSRLANWLSNKNANRDDIIELLQEMALTAGPQGFIEQQTATLNRLNRMDELRKIDIPTLIIQGEDDKLVPVAVAEAMAKALPCATLEIIKSAGHMSPLERPDMVAEILQSWFDRRQKQLEKTNMSTSRTLELFSASDEQSLKKKSDELNVYTLRRGTEGEQRLNVLNGIYNPDSEKFLLANGIQSAEQIIDIGCGTGQMACWIASNNPDSHVTCVDISEEQIKVAKKNAEKMNLTNMSFSTVSIYELEKLNKQFDFAYTRFVLAHLQEPSKALKSIQSILAPGGKFACEEAKTTDHLCSDVNDPTFKRYYELWTGLRKRKGSNPEFGSQLKFYGEQAGIDMKDSVTKNVDLSVESGLRSIFVHNLREIGPEAVRESMISQAELDALIPAMEKLIKRSDIVMRFSGSVQAAGKKPELKDEFQAEQKQTTKLTL